MSTKVTTKVTTKVAYNTTYGGFSLSSEATKLFNKLKGFSEDDEGYVDPKYGYVFNFERHDPDLIKAIEDTKDPSGQMSIIKIIEIEGNRYFIDEYDGLESVVTPETIHWVIIDKPEFREEYPEDYL